MRVALALHPVLLLHPPLQHPQRAASVRLGPIAWPPPGLAPPRRCPAVSAAGSSPRPDPARSATTPAASADRRRTPRDCRCRTAATAAGPSGPGMSATRPAPARRAPGRSSPGGKTRLCRAAPEHSSTTRSQEIISPVANRFWSAASTCQTACGRWARCRDRRGADRTGPGPGRADGANAGGCGPTGSRPRRPCQLSSTRIRTAPQPGCWRRRSRTASKSGGGRAGVTTAGVIAGVQIRDGPITGLGLSSASDQISDRADRQFELPSDLRRGGPEPGHAGDGQTRREFRGTWHRSGLPDPRTNQIPGLYRWAEMHETFVSGFCTELGVA